MKMIKRSPLPSRRETRNLSLICDNNEFKITIGFYPGEGDELGPPGEVFAEAGKTPQTIQQLVADACILISISLQHGVSPEALRHSLACFDDGSPYTILGVICDVLVNKGWEAPAPD